MQHAPSDPLTDAIRLALNTSHKHFAQAAGKARRYPSEVAPFAALDEPSEQAMRDLHSLMQPGETAFVLGDTPPPEVSGLKIDGAVPCFQMAYPETANLPEARPEVSARIEPLTCANAEEMLDLIAIAFPGYFRRRTCEMGAYFGIREGRQLVAMGGERMVLESRSQTFREISGVCTHPEHRGKGYARALMLHLMRQHRNLGAVSWLHAVTDNPAVALYRTMGFNLLREVRLNRIICAR